jgi:tetratricopeptide (TPR) repeat protein
MSSRLHPHLAALAAAIVLQGCSPSGQSPAATPDEAMADEYAPPLAVLVPGSGSYSRPISTESREAQQFFDQGLRLSWGFYFPEAIASHQEASRLDPGHPMPYWGMAHAMGPNPNSRYARMPDDPSGEGLKAIVLALERIDRASDLERELIRALYVRYDKESIPDDSERDEAYLAAMRALNARYPNDPDIAALYADSYMSIRRWDYWDAEGNPKSETLPVAEALERAIETAPGHPGSLHLHIHLIEASMQPERALGSADALEATMPIAGHVVHMPAHIYVRVGRYDQAIASNVRSQAADSKFAEIWGDNPFPNIGTYPLSHKIHAPHAIDFIRYAATVQGNYAVAIEAAERSAAFVTGDPREIRNGQKRSVGPSLVNKIFGKWNRLIGHEQSHSGTPYLDGMWAYALGSAYAATGDFDNAQAQLDALQSIAEAPNADEYRVGATPASAVLKLAAYGLEGEVKQALGDFDGAIAAFEAGIAIEDLNNYTEPPDWAQPMRHYLGAALLAAGRAEEAEAIYRRDLRWNQNNGWSLFGLQQSLAAQGRDSEAQGVRSLYETAWQSSDVVLAASRL